MNRFDPPPGRWVSADDAAPAGRPRTAERITSDEHSCHGVRCTALRLAGIDFELVDVDASGLVDELRTAGVRELPLVVTDDGDCWTGLRLDKIIELRRGESLTCGLAAVGKPTALSIVD
ncbi:MAG: hypothetical protein PGN24_06105 [Microbacterium arborescens]